MDHVGSRERLSPAGKLTFRTNAKTGFRPWDGHETSPVPWARAIGGGSQPFYFRIPYLVPRARIAEGIPFFATVTFFT